MGAAPVMPCQNSFWIMGLRIYEEGRTHIPLISPTTIGPLAGIQDRLGLYKINHIIVSFTGHYNAISFDRLSQKTKIGKRFKEKIHENNSFM